MRLGPLCTLLWRIPDLVLQETGYYQGLTHSRLPEYGSRQVIQAGPDHSNRMIRLSRGRPVDMHQVAPT